MGIEKHTFVFVISVPYFNPISRLDDTHRRIALVMDRITEESKSIVKSIILTDKLEEISARDANDLLMRSCGSNKGSENNSNK